MGHCQRHPVNLRGSNNPGNLDINSLERIVPDELESGGATGLATLEYHLARYTFAASHLRGSRLLDIACGVGYGTCYLAEHCSQITVAHGIDISAQAIAYARARYARPPIEYFCEDAMRFSCDQAYETIVSLETVEHMPDAAGFLKRLVRFLEPGGVLIASVPTTPSMDGNPNHLADFTRRSFRRLGHRAGLKEIAAFEQEQPFDAAAVASQKEKRLVRTPASLLQFYARRPWKLVTRVAATLRYGFANHYLTIVWEKPAESR
ncbi:MAG: class I SAM-dependent methyltransferase [Terriglobia bacterium]|nr:MAG: class I SAM-dependent methyltransferase [Terriglobia bacterium]